MRASTRPTLSRRWFKVVHYASQTAYALAFAWKVTNDAHAQPAACDASSTAFLALAWLSAASAAVLLVLTAMGAGIYTRNATQLEFAHQVLLYQSVHFLHAQQQPRRTDTHLTVVLPAVFQSFLGHDLALCAMGAAVVLPTYALADWRLQALRLGGRARGHGGALLRYVLRLVSLAALQLASVVISQLVFRSRSAVEQLQQERLRRQQQHVPLDNRSVQGDELQPATSATDRSSDDTSSPDVHPQACTASVLPVKDHSSTGGEEGAPLPCAACVACDTSRVVNGNQSLCGCARDLTAPSVLASSSNTDSPPCATGRGDEPTAAPPAAPSSAGRMWSSFAEWRIMVQRSLGSLDMQLLMLRAYLRGGGSGGDAAGGGCGRGLCGTMVLAACAAVVAHSAVQAAVSVSVHGPFAGGGADSVPPAHLLVVLASAWVLSCGDLDLDGGGGGVPFGVIVWLQGSQTRDGGGWWHIAKDGVEVSNSSFSSVMKVKAEAEAALRLLEEEHLHLSTLQDENDRLLREQDRLHLALSYQPATIIDAGTPADWILNLAADLLEGVMPDMHTVIRIQRAVLSSRDIFQPVDLGEQMRALSLADDVSAAIIAELAIGHAPPAGAMGSLEGLPAWPVIHHGTQDGSTGSVPPVPPASSYGGQQPPPPPQQQPRNCSAGCLDLDVVESGEFGTLAGALQSILLSQDFFLTDNCLSATPLMSEALPPTGPSRSHGPSMERLPLHLSTAAASAAAAATAGHASPQDAFATLSPTDSSVGHAAEALVGLTPRGANSSSTPRPRRFSRRVPSTLDVEGLGHVHSPLSLAPSIELQHLGGGHGSSYGGSRGHGALIKSANNSFNRASPSYSHVLQPSYSHALSPSYSQQASPAGLPPSGLHSSRRRSVDGVVLEGGAVAAALAAGAITPPESPFASRAFAEGVMAPPPPPLMDEVERVLLTSREWQFNGDLLYEVTCGHPLSTLAYYLIHENGLKAHFKIQGAKLARFFRRIETGYRESNPYHNRSHATNVLQALHVILTKSAIVPLYADPLTHLACLISASIHDYEHSGLTNDFLIASGNKLAVRYNDRSPQENHHLAAAFSLLCLPEYNFLSHLPKAEYEKLRRYIIELVLTTDMKQHFSVASQFNAVHRVNVAVAKLKPCVSAPAGEPSKLPAAAAGGIAAGGCGGSGEVRPLPPLLDDAERLVTLQMALKAADLGHMATDLPIHLRWVDRLEREMFLQGDKEKAGGYPVSPLFDRDKPGVTKCQVGFYDIVVIPLFMNFSTVFPDCKPLLTNALKNYAHWSALEAIKDAA